MRDALDRAADREADVIEENFDGGFIDEDERDALLEDLDEEHRFYAEQQRYEENQIGPAGL